MTERILKLICEKFPLTEKSIGEFSTFKAKGMTFKNQAFCAEGLGHVCVMRASGFFGLMKMDTLVVAPTQLDLPLLSYDRIYAMGNDTLIVELYDTMGEKKVALDGVNDVKKRYARLPERFAEGEEPPHWYDSIRLPETTSKKGKKRDSASFDEYTEQYLRAYLASYAEACDSDAKKSRTDEYVNGLVKQGGPATDVFKQQFGEEQTERILKEVLFGTK